MKWCPSPPLSEPHRRPPVTGIRTRTCSSKPSIIDAKTNQTVAKVVRKVFGSTLENESQKITVQDFKAAIDKLNVDLWAFIRS